jgi:hypothetical protein
LPFNANAVAWLQLALSAAGVAFLGWSYAVARGSRPQAWRGLRDTLLAALGILGAASYFNFGQLHYPNFIHVWDTYHYYIGAKYFPELGYDRIYICTVVADAEVAGRENVQGRLFTDLRTNTRVPAAVALDDPQACKRHFTPQRWDSFQRDLGFFRVRVSLPIWERMLKDHGYNASPVWTALGHALADTGPATKVQVLKLVLLDPLFLLAMVAMIAWAFGWRVAMVAMLFLGTAIPSRYLWTGGAFLRHDWLFWLVGSVCLLKKDKPFLAGAFIAYATLLRLFPAVAIAGPVCLLIEIYRREKRLDRRLLRYFAGGIAATAVLVSLSLATPGSVETWRDFARNTQKHASTAYTNHMGLPFVLGFRPATTGKYMYKATSSEPWNEWKDKRAESFRQLKPLFVVLCGVFLVMLYFAVAGAAAEPWIAASLGMGMIAVGTDLSCYYYGFFVGVVLAMHRRMEAGIFMMLLSLGWQIVDRASKSPFDDEKYVAMSVLALVAYAVILLRFAGVLRPWTPALPGNEEEARTSGAGAA